MDAVDVELAIIATETSEEILSLLPLDYWYPTKDYRYYSLTTVAKRLREKQRILSEAVAAYPGPLVQGRLDEPGPIATSLIVLATQLTRVSMLVHGLARVTDERMAASLYNELTSLHRAANDVIAAVTPHNFTGIRKFMDDEWLGNVLTKSAEN